MKRTMHLISPERARGFLAPLALAAITAILIPAGTLSAQAPPETPAAWRVECTGDGKSLECRAIQQIFQRDTRQLVASVAVRFAPELKAGSMSILLPLGLNLTEPVAIKARAPADPDLQQFRMPRHFRGERQAAGGHADRHRPQAHGPGRQQEADRDVAAAARFRGRLRQDQMSGR
jgi:hypothetical protein